MPCDELAALQWAYQDAIRQWARAVLELREDGIGVAITEFMLLWKLAQRAKDDCNVANRALQEHILEHKCAKLPVY